MHGCGDGFPGVCVCYLCMCVNVYAGQQTTQFLLSNYTIENGKQEFLETKEGGAGRQEKKGRKEKKINVFF